MDLLNMHVSLKHSFMSMGNWTFAFEDFDREDIMAQFRVSAVSTRMYQKLLRTP